MIAIFKCRKIIEVMKNIHIQLTKYPLKTTFSNLVIIFLSVTCIKSYTYIWAYDLAVTECEHVVCSILAC